MPSDLSPCLPTRPGAVPHSSHSPSTRRTLVISCYNNTPSPKFAFDNSTSLPIVSFQALTTTKSCNAFVLTTIRIGGVAVPLSHRPKVPHILQTSYTLTPLFATLRKTAGVYTLSS